MVLITPNLVLAISGCLFFEIAISPGCLVIVHRYHFSTLKLRTAQSSANSLRTSRAVQMVRVAQLWRRNLLLSGLSNIPLYSGLGSRRVRLVYFNSYENRIVLRYEHQGFDDREPGAYDYPWLDILQFRIHTAAVSLPRASLRATCGHFVWGCDLHVYRRCPSGNCGFPFQYAFPAHRLECPRSTPVSLKPLLPPRQGQWNSHYRLAAKLPASGLGQTWNGCLS